MSLNLYTYCHNEPIQYVDLSGHNEQLRAYYEGLGCTVDYISGDTNKIKITNPENGKTKTLTEGTGFIMEGGKAIISEYMIDQVAKTLFPAPKDPTPSTGGGGSSGGGSTGGGTTGGGTTGSTSSSPPITNPAKPTNLADMDIGKAINAKWSNVGTNSPLHIRISGNTLYIDYYFFFAGAWDTVCPDSGGKNYGDLFRDGIMQYWDGKTVDMSGVLDKNGNPLNMANINIKVNLYIVREGDFDWRRESQRGPFLKVDFDNIPSYGHVSWPYGKSLDKPGSVGVGILDYDKKNVKWSANDFMFVAAHEFGHLLGIGGEFYEIEDKDNPNYGKLFKNRQLIQVNQGSIYKESGYSYKAYTDPYDIMLNFTYPNAKRPPTVTALDMIFILEALAKGQQVSVPKIR